MPAIKVHRPKSLYDYVELVQKAQESGKVDLWFRGCGNVSHTLLPSLYRHPSKSTSEEYSKLERSLVTRFIQRSIPFNSRTLAEGWDSLFYMQHFGVPTRLLDWSENPFIAFYFAVMSARAVSGTYQNDAVVWILNPSLWNQHAMKDQSYKDGILSSNDPRLVAYETLDNHVNMPNAPVAIYGAHNSQRIVAQRGVFAVFGKSLMPMEAIFRKDSYPAASLSKVVLTASHIKKLRNEILSNGITESVVMPDLDGLAREIRRQFGYEA